MLQPRARWRAAVAVMFLAAQVSAIATPVASQAQSTTTTTSKPKTTTTTKQPPVDEGQSYYEQSRFDDAITLLKQLVDQGVLQGAELQRAQELLARSYVKKGYPVQGKEMFKTMLRADSTYRPDPIRVPPDETAVFDEALKEFQSEKSTAPPVVPPPATTKTTAPSPEKIGVASSTDSGKKKGLTSQWWFWAGGALLVGGIAAAAMGSGGDDTTPTTSTDLETFPPTP